MFFDSFRAAPIFRRFVGGSEKPRVGCGEVSNPKDMSGISRWHRSSPKKCSKEMPHGSLLASNDVGTLSVEI